MFLLAYPNTFIIDSSMRRDRPWLGAWRVSRPRVYERSTFTAYNRSEVDRVRQTVETWCVMVSIIDLVMTDERSGISTVIRPAQEQLVEIGNDKLPSFPWDLGVHLVRRMFHYLTTQVSAESHTLHLGLVWREPAGTCPMGQDLSSLVIIMIGNGDVWTGSSSTLVSMPIQFLGCRFSGHRYFSLRIQARRIQYVCRGHAVMVRVV
jgi:hypothetical protein